MEKKQTEHKWLYLSKTLGSQAKPLTKNCEAESDAPKGTLIAVIGDKVNVDIATRAEDRPWVHLTTEGNYYILILLLFT